MLLYQILAFTIHEKNMKSSNFKFKISAPTWDEEFALPDECEDYFEHIFKKMEKILINFQ